MGHQTFLTASRLRKQIKYQLSTLSHPNKDVKDLKETKKKYEMFFFKSCLVGCKAPNVENNLFSLPRCWFVPTDKFSERCLVVSSKAPEIHHVIGNF